MGKLSKIKTTVWRGRFYFFEKDFDILNISCQHSFQHIVQNSKNCESLKKSLDLL